MRSLSAAGRVTVSGSARDMQSLQDKHRAYLQSLQNKNQAAKVVREAEQLRRQDRIKREQGFNCCFSGANATVRKSSARRSSSSGGTPGPAAGNGFFAIPKPCASDACGYGCSQWEERTVEIRAEGGEIYSIRPCGERSEPRSQGILLPGESLQEAKHDDVNENACALRVIATADQNPCLDSLGSTPSVAAKVAKEKALALLRASRQAPPGAFLDETLFGMASEDDISERGDEIGEDSTETERSSRDMGDLPDMASTVVTKDTKISIGNDHVESTPLASTRSNDAVTLDYNTASSRELVDPAMLAERIARLPAKWRESLLQRLEEAEAEVTLSQPSVIEDRARRHGDDSPCGSEATLETRELTSLGIAVLPESLPKD